MTWKKRSIRSANSSAENGPPAPAIGSRKRGPDEPKQIDGLYLVLATSQDGDEGIVAVGQPGQMLPLFCTKRSTMLQWDDSAQTAADGTGEVMKVVRFERARVVKEFHPRKEGGS